MALNYYKSVVRSKIEYCKTSTTNFSKTVNKIIETYQNSFLRRSFGLTPATPIPIIYAIANELPPAERATWLTAKEIINNFISDKDFRQLMVNSDNVDSSYSRVFGEFRNVCMTSA